MSSIFAFLAAAVVKVIPFDVEATRLKAENDDLKRQCDDLRAEVDRWMTLANSWQRRYEETAYSQGGGGYFAAQNTMLQQAQLSQVQFYNQAMPGQQALLGQQALDPELFCNCVPARHDMFLPPRS